MLANRHDPSARHDRGARTCVASSLADALASGPARGPAREPATFSRETSGAESRGDAISAECALVPWVGWRIASAERAPVFWVRTEPRLIRDAGQSFGAGASETVSPGDPRRRPTSAEHGAGRWGRVEPRVSAGGAQVLWVRSESVASSEPEPGLLVRGGEPAVSGEGVRAGIAVRLGRAAPDSWGRMLLWAERSCRPDPGSGAARRPCLRTCASVPWVRGGWARRADTRSRRSCERTRLA